MKVVIIILSLLFTVTPKPCDRKFVYGKKCPDYYQKCIELIKHYEKYRAMPYELFGDRYIGYGHLVKKGESFDSISEPQAETLLKKDFDAGLKYVPDSFEYKEKLLLGLYAYNCGVGKMKKFIKKPVTRERYLSTCYIKGKLHKGLEQRRVKEYNIFEHGK